MTKMDKKYTIGLSALLISSAVFAIYGIKGLSKTTISSIEKNQDKATSEVIAQLLTILGDRCRGCGKCVRIDPEHFEINENTKKAMVISSINLNSVSLRQAINNCPGGAISLK